MSRCCFVVNTCCIDRDPSSESHAASPHGRVAGLTILIQAVLVVVYSLDAVLHTTFMVTVTCLASVCLAYAYMKYQPFYKLSVSKAYCFASLIMCWASFCLVLLQCRKQPRVRGFQVAQPFVQVGASCRRLQRLCCPAEQRGSILVLAWRSQLWLCWIRGGRMVVWPVQHNSPHNLVGVQCERIAVWNRCRFLWCMSQCTACVYVILRRSLHCATYFPSSVKMTTRGTLATLGRMVIAWMLVLCWR
jgi:hypothetical protein